MNRWLRLMLLSAALSGVAATARAQSQPDATRALKERGDQLMEDLHFREALEQYDAALKLGAGSAVQYNRARALQALGEYPRALDALEEFVRTATPELRARVPQLDELIADLRAHVATLTIACDVPNATVRIRHELVGTTPIGVPVRVSVGSALVEADAPGYRPFSRDVTFASGESRLVVALEKASDASPPPELHPLEVHPVDAPRAGTWMRPAAFATGGVGLALIGAGAIFGGLAIARRSDLDGLCPDKSCDAPGAQARSDAWTYATLSTVGFAVGGVAAASAVVLYLLSPSRAGRRVGVSPYVAPGAAGIVGTF